MTTANKKKTIKEWLSECPTAWNLEYNEDFDRFCYFFHEDEDEDEDEDEEEKTFLESF